MRRRFRCRARLLASCSAYGDTTVFTLAFGPTSASVTSSWRDPCVTCGSSGCRRPRFSRRRASRSLSVRLPRALGVDTGEVEGDLVEPFGHVGSAQSSAVSSSERVSQPWRLGDRLERPSCSSEAPSEEAPRPCRTENRPSADLAYRVCANAHRTGPIRASKRPRSPASRSASRPAAPRGSCAFGSVGDAAVGASVVSRPAARHVGSSGRAGRTRARQPQRSSLPVVGAHTGRSSTARFACPYRLTAPATESQKQCGLASGEKELARNTCKLKELERAEVERRLTGPEGR